MVMENEGDANNLTSQGSQDVDIVKKNLVGKVKDAFTKPVTLLIAGLVFILTLTFEYAFSRTLDAIWEVEPPEEIVRINTELKSSSGQLRETSRELETLIARIDTSEIEDPRLREQLEQLDERLLGLNDLIQSTTDNADRAAILSETLQEDWVRVKSQSEDSIDGVPDLLLAIGEGVELCGGLTSIGVRQLQTGRVFLSLSDAREDMLAGARLQISDQAYVDYIGTRNDKALFKVSCGEG